MGRFLSVLTILLLLFATCHEIPVPLPHKQFRIRHGGRKRESYLV